MRIQTCSYLRSLYELIQFLSTDLGKDIQARHDGEEKYGFDVWFAGHRDGESGVNDPDTADIKGKSLICPGGPYASQQLTFSNRLQGCRSLDSAADRER